MYKNFILSTLSLLSLSLLGMNFNDFPKDIQEYIIKNPTILASALNKDTLGESLRNLRMVSKGFYAFLDKKYFTQDAVLKALAQSLDITPRAMALHIIKVYKLNRQEAQELISKYPLYKKLDQALLDAIEKGSCQTVATLLKQNADSNAQKGGVPALVYAIQGDHKTIVQLLLEYAADVNAQDAWGHSALMRVNSKGMASLLIKHGARVNTQNKQGLTNLIFAAQYGNKDTVELLLNHGAQVNTQDTRYGKTALMYAAEIGCQAIVELLLKCDANINAQDKQGNTALMYATWRDSKEIIELLFKYGADVTIKNKEGKTALDIAEDNDLLVCSEGCI